MQEHHIVVPRHARFATLGAAQGARELWVACHGYGQLASPFLAQLAALDDGTRLIAAPEGLSRFYLPARPDGTGGTAPVHGPEVGASWMTREDREREMVDQVGYLDRLHQLLGARVAADATLVVLGFSQGAAAAARWTAHARGRVRRLIMWGALLPPELADEGVVRAALGHTSVAIVCGERDALVPQAAVAAQVQWLARLDIEARLYTFGGGHRLDEDTLREVAAG